MKKILFYTFMLIPIIVITLPFMYLFSMSLLTYATLSEPSVCADYDKSWIHIATDIHYAYEANIWQSQHDCVEYDEVFLYRPSSGCVFSNPEFSTKLTFSQDGRTWDNRSKLEGQKPVFVLGDSLSMGWGVNDDETFSHIMEKTLSVPFYNLSVSSAQTQTNDSPELTPGV